VQFDSSHHTIGADAPLQITVLPNGLNILSETVASVSSLALGVWINVGSRDETQERNGISHFIEHAVFKGTSRRKTHQIAQYLEVIGGYVNAFTTKDATCFYARVREQYLARAVDLLADITLHPAFLPKEIEKEKQVILEEMHAIDDDPEERIHDLFDKNLFGMHPLGLPILGAEEAINAFTEDTLHRFIADEYTAQNVVIAASGAVLHEQLVRLCERAFDGIGTGNRRLRARPRPHKPRHESFEKSVQQPHLVFGRMTPGLKNRDKYALTLLNTILGDGMSSRLFQTIREKYGYAYNIFSSLSLFEDSGIFSIYLASQNGKTERCREIIRNESEALRRKPVSPRELNRAREQVIGGLLLGLESMSSRMNRIGKDFLTFHDVIPLETMIAELYAVTPDDILRVAQYACDEANYFSTEVVPAKE
jgi:predicted Zn-dependent peptidase